MQRPVPLLDPRTIPAWLLTAAWPTLVLAHAEAGMDGGLASGFAHPVSGLDHVLAMVAVGLWGAQLGGPAIWLLPIAFPLVMAFGGLLGLLGVDLPGVEVGIALSAVGLGLAVLTEARPALGLALGAVAVFALFHGHAHGAELPAGASAIAYSIGFVAATGLLHLTGIGIGSLNRWTAGALVLRGAGALVAVGGAAFLWLALVGGAA